MDNQIKNSQDENPQLCPFSQTENSEEKDRTLIAKDGTKLVFDKSYFQESPLSDEEKYGCVVRWLNVFYRALLLDEAVPHDADPCYECPLNKKCPSLKWTPNPENTIVFTMPLFVNWKVLEKHTGKNTVFPNRLDGGYELVNREINRLVGKDASEVNTNIQKKEYNQNLNN